MVGESRLGHRVKVIKVHFCLEKQTKTVKRVSLKKIRKKLNGPWDVGNNHDVKDFSLNKSIKENKKNKTKKKCKTRGVQAEV